MFPQLSVSNFNFLCEPCQLVKHCRSIYPISNKNKSSVSFQLVHTDVWGPLPTTSLSGFRYFVTFVDNCSCTTWVYLLKHKSDVFAAFKSFHFMVSTQFNAKIQILRSDNGGEYISCDFSSFFDASGIVHQTTCSDTPKQNGVAEQKNYHLWEISHAILFTMNVCKTVWSDALLTVVYLMNKMPTHVLSHKTPLETLLLSSPLFSLPPKTFGCVCYVHVLKLERTKLDPKALKCVFLGYGTNQKGYKCFHPPTRRFFVSRDVTFFESVPFFASRGTSLQGEKLPVSNVE